MQIAILLALAASSIVAPTPPTHAAASLSHVEAMDLMSLQRLSYRALTFKDLLNRNGAKFDRAQMRAIIDGTRATATSSDAENAVDRQRDKGAYNPIQGARFTDEDDTLPVDRYGDGEFDIQALEHITSRYPDLHAPLRDQTFSLFGVVVSDASKTCFVIFRGTARPREWLTDGDKRLISLAKATDDMPEVQGIGAKVKVHNGFANALLEDWVSGENTIDSTYNRIANELTKYPGYKIRVGGHSLGGALTSLFVYIAAHDSRLAARQVLGLAAASPRVGNYHWKTSFEALKNVALVRLCRPGDVVTCAPEFGRRIWQRYHHVYQQPTLFVSARGIKAYMSSLKRNKFGPLARVTRWLGRSFVMEPAPPEPMAFPRTTPASPLCTSVERSTFEQIRPGETSKARAVFNYFLGHSVKAHSAKKYLRDLDTVADAAFKLNLLAPLPKRVSKLAQTTAAAAMTTAAPPATAAAAVPNSRPSVSA
jgi:hypothetical protein